MSLQGVRYKRHDRLSAGHARSQFHYHAGPWNPQDAAAIVKPSMTCQELALDRFNVNCPLTTVTV